MLLFGLFWAYSWQTLDPDFGWHLAAGNYILHHWIPPHDIYSYTAQSYHWIDHEWGNDVITAILYRIGKYWLTTTVFAAAWTLSLCLFRRRLHIVLLLLATIAVLPYAGIRPTVWTVCCLALLLELANQTSPRAKTVIPFLILVWANLHGGFIIGLVLILYFSLRNHQLGWLAVLSASVAASFINPYGPRLYVEVAHTLFDPALHRDVSEWRSFYILPSGWLFIGLWSAGFWLYDKQKLQNWISVTPFLALASLSATRNIPLFVVGSLRDIDRYLRYTRLPKQLDRPRKILIAVASTFIATIVIYYLYTSYLPWKSRYAVYPVQEVAYLQMHHCSGNLFNDYAYGGYLIWRLPNTPDFIDGRMPTWRDPNGLLYVDRYNAILKSSLVQRQAFSQYHITCVLLMTSPADHRLLVNLQSHAWHTAATGDGAVLLTAPR